MYAIIATILFGREKPEYFGNFSQSFFSMLQMATFDSWASAITRSFRNDEGGVAPQAIGFFSSYALVVGVVLMNVVVAVS
jgi:voltage-gated sodium channel